MSRNLVWAVLLCSVAANVGFAFALRSRAKIADPGYASDSTSTVEKTNPAAAGDRAPAIAASASTASNRRLAFDPARPQELAIDLRAAGFPEPVIRDIVRAAVAEHFSARRDALLARIPMPSFRENWRTPPEIEAALSDLRREQADLARAALGASALSEDERHVKRARYGEITDEKLLALERIERDYGELSQRTRQEMRGEMSFIRFLPWERTQLDYIEAEKRRDIAALLSPDELLAYDLRTSKTAEALRSRLAFFEPTEQEYRALHELFRPTLEQWGTSLVSSFGGQQGAALYVRPPGVAMPSGLAATTNAQVRAVLGDTRFADYQRSLDSGYQAAYQVTFRHGLPVENARAVYDLQQSSRARQTEIMRDPSVPLAERRAALETLGRDANTQITQLLGEAGCAAYRQRGGSWLTSLESAVQRMGQAPGRGN